ncbi:MAG: phosphoenolpyruvate--protein phosphotransferase [Rhodospirillaceae bacterium]|nr:phosphoenolpyruvate--protein phosphotransferase [Rhodospirillaceae bacterium]
MRKDTPEEATAQARPAADTRPELVFTGLGVSPGIAIGAAQIVERGAVPVPEYTIAESAVAAEKERFAAAVKRAQRQLRKLKAKAEALPERAADEAEILLDAHLHMLGSSRVLRGVERRIAEHRVNAEAAVQAEINEIADSFAGLNDSYLAARAADIRDVGDRLIRSLTQTSYAAFKHLPKGSVIVAEELTPADTALLDPRQIGGLATVLGGAESHTAIMARSIGLPAVLGVAGLFGRVGPGEEVIVDGNAGRVIVNPTPATRAEYRRRQAVLLRQGRALARLRDLQAVTRDGIRIALHANIELPRELDSAVSAGAEGVGLLRTEFLFMNRDDLPGEDEQYETLRELVVGLRGRPLTVRTLDLGGEKFARALGVTAGGGVNPALGLRAIRLSMRYQPLLEAQLAAILRAGAHGPVRILLPMISCVAEMRHVRKVLMQVARRLRRRGVAIADPLPPLGAMIELPGAALAADALAEVCEFFALGTNDLTMYTLAVDRGDEQLAHLYNPLHPAVLRLIHFTAVAAARAGIPISVCGEVAGDPRYVALLLGLGIRELSMVPAALLRVKQRIRRLDLAAAQRAAHTIMGQHDSGRIAAILDDFNGA